MINLQQRISFFRKEVIEVGGLIYKKSMLEEFIIYWSEENRAKNPKQKWEIEKTWNLSMRLSRWARNAKDYNPYLSSHETTIEGKKRDFILQMRPFADKYPPDVLNGFYRHFTTPENKAKPEMIRWENEKYWSLEDRLKTWSERDAQQKAKLNGAN